MRPPFAPRFLARKLALCLLALALAAIHLGAQTATHPAAAQTAAEAPSGSAAAAEAAPAEPAGHPEPFGLALLAMVLCGAAGACAADLVTDGGRLARWKRGEQGWTLAALGKLIVGPAAAVVLLALNPAGPAWPPLVATSLVAGVGAEALLLYVISARRAQDAENARHHAEEEVRRAGARAARKLESLGALAVEIGGGRRVRIDALRVAGAAEEDGDGPAGAGEADEPSFESLIRSAVERAKTELAAG